MDKKMISKKKVPFPITDRFLSYLKEYGRTIQIPIAYPDLLRFEDSVPIVDENGEDTLWVNCIYSSSELDELVLNLKRLYSILHADGSDTILPYITIDSIAFCTFGNTKPFRIKVRNIINDNYIFLYIKQCDASRIYGLELEHLLSPNLINFLIHRDTLIEEHIVGVPGDVFIKEKLPGMPIQDKRALAKEYVKFNERSFIRLLGDMRSYNYVVVITQDFDRIQYRIRAIDFDQQSYEGNSKVYKPQFLPENSRLSQMTLEVLTPGSMDQYVKEERSLLAKRATSENKRLHALMDCMREDQISSAEKIKELRSDLFALTRCKKKYHSFRKNLEFTSIETPRKRLFM